MEIGDYVYFREDKYINCWDVVIDLYGDKPYRILKFEGMFGVACKNEQGHTCTLYLYDLVRVPSNYHARWQQTHDSKKDWSKNGF